MVSEIEQAPPPTDDIQLLAETLNLFTEQVTAALAAHRIVISAVLSETLTKDQRRRVMGVSDLLVDTWQPPHWMDANQLRQMVLQSVASFETAAPPDSAAGPRLKKGN